MLAKFFLFLVVSALFLATVKPSSAQTMASDKPEWAKMFFYNVTCVDPSPEKNRLASAFPGYRGSNQLVVYDRNYDRATTGTNEFGFEVTVVDGRVVDQEGSDSKIPRENGFVLSGHGDARRWLLRNAPLGARITLSPETGKVTSTVSLETYLFQLDKKMESAKSKVNPLVLERIEGEKQGLKLDEPESSVAAIQQLIGQIDEAVLQSIHVFPGQAIRGTWHRPVENSPEEVSQKLDEIQKMGLNTVFLETFYHGYTIFPSKTYGEFNIPVSQNPRFKGWDPLESWIKLAHQRGIKVHVWFQSFYVGNDTIQGPGAILSAHPDWANIQYSALSQSKPLPSTLEPGAYFADPANPEACRFLLALADEIVTRYDIDGFQLDYMDYPLSFPPDRVSYLQTTWGYTPIARQLFAQSNGVDPAKINPQQTELWERWAKFKEEQVNQFVRQAAAKVRECKPNIQVSATAFVKILESKVKKHEDWPLWSQQGWIDFLAPMLLTSSVKVVDQDTKFVLQATQNKIPVIAGIFSPFNGSAPDILVSQILAASEAGARGFSVFDTAHLTAEHRHTLQKLFNSRE